MLSLCLFLAGFLWMLPRKIGAILAATILVLCGTCIVFTLMREHFSDREDRRRNLEFLAVFERIRPEFAAKYPGDFVAIARDEVIGHGPSEDQLARDMRNKYPTEFIFIKRV